MRKTFGDRLQALERADHERDNRAVGWALSMLTPAEFNLFCGFWGRDCAEGGAYAYEGAEADAVVRFQELYDYARLRGLRTEEPYYAPIFGEAARRLRAAGA